MEKRLKGMGNSGGDKKKKKKERKIHKTDFGNGYAMLQIYHSPLNWYTQQHRWTVWWMSFYLNQNCLKGQRLSSSSGLEDGRSGEKLGNTSDSEHCFPSPHLSFHCFWNKVLQCGPGWPPIFNPPVSASLVCVFQMLSSTRGVDAHLSTFPLESTFVNVLPYTCTILNEPYFCWTI